jgi:ABC-2 type transport system ATP-binding protein
MIQANNLTKYYADTCAVDNLSFEVGEGEILGFLGPNGAGKTTTMKMLTGFFLPHEGTATVAGADIRTESMRVRQMIGYLQENVPLYTEMEVEDYLIFNGRMRGLSGRELSSQIAKVAGVCGLDEVAWKPIRHLSKGYRQRVGLAQALIHAPPILILDEPTSGLDPNQIVEIREKIRRIGKEKTVILCSHILPEVQLLCDRILIIDRGKLIACGTAEELIRKACGREAVFFEAKGDNIEKDLRRQFDDVECVTALSRGYTRLKIRTTESRKTREQLFSLAAQKRWKVVEISPQAPGLEEAFGILTGRGGPAGRLSAFFKKL